MELSSLADEPFIMYPYDLGGGFYDITMNLCRKAGFAPRIEQEAKTVPMAVSLAAAGLGLALVPGCIPAGPHTRGGLSRARRRGRDRPSSPSRTARTIGPRGEILRPHERSFSPESRTVDACGYCRVAATISSCLATASRLISA